MTDAEAPAPNQNTRQITDKSHCQTFSNPVKTQVSERILRKTVEITEAREKSFLKEPKCYIKRSCHTVRKRSLNYIATLKQKYGVSHEIPLEAAKRIFQEELDIWDRTSLKAYFGTQTNISKRTIQRTAIYHTGTVSNKTIELRQYIFKSEGYLERLGLVKFEKRGNTWFMILANNETIVQEIRHSQTRVYERVEPQPIENFSLTPILQESRDTEAEIEKRECHRRREKSPSESHQKRAATSVGPLLTPTEKATIEDRDRKRIAQLDQDYLSFLEKSVEKSENYE